MKIYLDENLPPQLASGLHILEQPNREGFEIYSTVDQFGRGIRDEDWIPEVGLVGGIVITQDIKIQRTRHLFELYRENGLGVFFFKAPSNTGYTYWEMVVEIIKRWEDIKVRSKDTRRPFAFRITKRGIHNLKST